MFSKAALAGYKDHGLELFNPFVGLKLRRVEIRGYSPLKPDVLQTIWKNAALLRDGTPGPKDQVKSVAATTTCPVCGGPIPKKRPTGPARRYCSPKCRNRARWAEPDWSEPHPEAYLILLLELGLGLRRHESDKAQKDWFFTDAQGLIRIEVKPTPHFTPKSRERRVIPVDKVLHDAIAPYLRENSAFIVPGRDPKVYPPGKQPKNLVYRCDEHHRTLARWLRLQGIQDDKPCHLLRKQFGSYVATTFGLYHAQKFLGHSSPKVTSDYYAGLVELPELNHLQLPTPHGTRR
jgi:integrase